MKINPNGFREYDARWIFEKEIDLEGITNLGKGLGTQIIQNTKINNLLTLVFVLLGPFLAISTFISADLFQETTSTILLRNLLLLDLIYV